MGTTTNNYTLPGVTASNPLFTTVDGYVVSDSSGHLALTTTPPGGGPCSEIATDNFQCGTAVANGGESTAVGETAKATGLSSSAYGFNAQATGKYSSAFGENSAATGDYASAFGDSSSAGIQSVAVGYNAHAVASSATAIGEGSTASGQQSTAVGNGATAAYSNSAAFGQGAAASGANNQAFGTSSNTYTFAGINSAASKANQTGSTYIVTSDANGNLATSGISVDQLNSSINGLGEGVAMAMAMGGMQVPQGSHFALHVGYGNFNGSSALGGALAGTVFSSPTVVVFLNGGLGYGVTTGKVGGTVGATFAW